MQNSLTNGTKVNTVHVTEREGVMKQKKKKEKREERERERERER